MKDSKERIKKTSKSSGIMLLILIFAVVLNASSCHRNVGVKSGKQLKADKSKCKCKNKKGGKYGDFHDRNNMIYNDRSSVNINLLG